MTLRQIRERARQLDVVHETDARRAERLLRGNITQVGVEGFAWYRHEQTVDSEGIGIEFEERAKAMGAARPEPRSTSHSLDAGARIR
jgi:hypothetical protein